MYAKERLCKELAEINLDWWVELRLGGTDTSRDPRVGRW